MQMSSSSPVRLLPGSCRVPKPPLLILGISCSSDLPAVLLCWFFFTCSFQIHPLLFPVLSLRRSYSRGFLISKLEHWPEIRGDLGAGAGERGRPARHTPAHRSVAAVPPAVVPRGQRLRRARPAQLLPHHHIRNKVCVRVRVCACACAHMCVHVCGLHG